MAIYRAGPGLHVTQYLDALRWHTLRQALPVASGGPILELGGGTGRWTMALAGLGYRLTMVEVSPRRLSIARRRLRAAGLEGLVQLHCADMAALDDLPAAGFGLVLATGSSLDCCAGYRRAISQMKRLCRSDGHVLLDAASRLAHLPELIRHGDLEAANALVLDGTFCRSPGGRSVRRHEFEIKELLGLLWDSGLTVVSALGRSVLLGILGRRGLARLLREMDAGRLIALEEALSQNESLIDRAQYFQVLCQTG